MPATTPEAATQPFLNVQTGAVFIGRCGGRLRAYRDSQAAAERIKEEKE